jgi:hypothetical protein
MNRASYIRFELLRTVRNRRFFILALGSRSSSTS